MSLAERVVFDCNEFFQAMISPGGPAGECIAVVRKGKLTLIVSQHILDEYRDVCSRPRLVNRFKLSVRRVDCFISQRLEMSTLVADVPHVFEYVRDPDDEHYVDLALATNSKLIVSRDKDLLALEDQSTPEGRSFHQRFPELTILMPEELLMRLRAN